MFIYVFLFVVALKCSGMVYEEATMIDWSAIWKRDERQRSKGWYAHSVSRLFYDVG